MKTAPCAPTPPPARTLLPAGELFAASQRLDAHPEIARAQSALLVRWALDPRHGVREAFWRFALRSAEGPVHEELFRAHFGFGYSDLRDRLSDYLPTALHRPLTLPPGKLPALPRVEVRPATPSEIARLRGEWERLSVPLVRRRYPEATERYLAQARRTLHRAWDAGERDAPLQATLGLCEIDAGNDQGARDFLETAVAGEVVRPRAYYELARLRWAELTRDQPPAREFAAAEISPIVRFARHGLTQAPALPAAYGLLADVWLRASAAPPADELTWLAENAPHFAADPSVCLRVARALARHGRTANAITELGAGFLHLRDAASRQQFARAYEVLKQPR